MMAEDLVVEEETLEVVGDGVSEVEETPIIIVGPMGPAPIPVTNATTQHKDIKIMQLLQIKKEAVRIIVTDGVGAKRINGIK